MDVHEELRRVHGKVRGALHLLDTAITHLEKSEAALATHLPLLSSPSTNNQTEEVTMSNDAIFTEMKKMLNAVPQPARPAPMNPWQQRFTLMIGMLIVFAYSRGYALSFGNARTDKGCTVCGGGKRKATSLHFDGLAVDLNLFKDGKFLTATADHRELGEFWESIGGSWGGRFNDGNHYSLAHNGRK